MQRRALDAARSKLGSLQDRDAILDCFFQHSQTLFKFAVLLVVRGDLAHGRYVHGIGAPDGLVERLAVPLTEPGILARARDLRRPVLGGGTMTPADEQLFGTLGRTIPSGLVVPLVVRDRVVALLIGDGAADVLDARGKEQGRTGIELAKEEMLLWAEHVGDALEKLILRVKKATGSVPPPRMGSTAPGRLGSVPPPARVPQDLSPPPPFEPPRRALSSPPPFTSLAPPPDEAPATGAPKRRGWLALVVVAAVAAGAAFAYFKVYRQEVDNDRVVAKGNELAGWPSAVDPVRAVEAARKAAGGGELASIRAEVGKGGVVDLAAPARQDEGTPLAFTFVNDASESEVRVDRAGVHAPRTQTRRTCNGAPCRSAVPVPQCQFSQIWEAAQSIGVRDEDRAVITYQSGDGAGGAPTRPEWTVSVAGRGGARIDAAGCKAIAREKIRPPRLPLTSAAGAPSAVQPMKTAETARVQSGLDADAVLVQVEASGVGPGGTVSFAPGSDGSIAYSFTDPPEVPANSRRWRRVELHADGFQVTADEQERGPLPAQLDSMLPPPRCDFAQAFAYMTLDVPAVTTARVTYGSDLVSHQGRWTLATSGGTTPSISDIECDAWAGLHAPAVKDVAPPDAAAPPKKRGR